MDSTRGVGPTAATTDHGGRTGTTATDEGLIDARTATAAANEMTAAKETDGVASNAAIVINRRSNSIENDLMQVKAHYYSESEVNESSTKSLLIVGGVFISAICALALVYLNFPDLDENEQHVLKLPTTMDDAKALGIVLSRYTDTHYYQVLVAYFSTYVFLQSFAIPGSIFLSILSGFLFPFPTALFFVCLSSASGASFCYLLSYLVGRRLVWRHFPGRAAEWSSHVQRNRDHLLNYMIFLRITPFLPNWFINITAPVINVPLAPFFFGTFLGVAPPSFVAIKAGITIQQLTSSRETVTYTSLLVMAVLAVISLLPVIFKDRLRKKFD